jgi:hypothetical protein
VTASEFAFLAFGLVLGGAAGVALVEILRARPPAPRDVKVTVSTESIPLRRASTLADDAFAFSRPEPARGGPADRRSEAAGDPPDGHDRRTPVPFPVRPDADRSAPVPGQILTPALPLRGPSNGGPSAMSSNTSGASGHVLRAPFGADDRPSLVALPITGGTDPMPTRLRSTAAATALAALRSGTATTAVLDRPNGPVATGTEMPGDTASEDAVATSSGIPGGVAAPAEPCAEPRRLADERCQLATRARAQAGTAADFLRAAQRAYDEHEGRADAATIEADPRAVRRAKDEAQLRFRSERSLAADDDGVEAAARTWLAEINRINGTAREAAAVRARERAAATEIGARLERLSLEADAARIAAETAEAACLAARAALADCEERAGGALDQRPMVGTGVSGGGPDDEPLAAALEVGGTPRVFRLVRGDRAALAELVDALAGPDPEERRRWQSSISDLVDAILADAVEAAVLTFPEDHPFWGPFTLGQDRDIALALASLGYRFDGIGGWVDGRVPSQRDLSLALGYAGLDPMRIRHWPTEAEMTRLFADVAVAADEHLAGAAGDLTLGELVSMLGRRADGLADVWNAWGRIRPLLLEESRG